MSKLKSLKEHVSALEASTEGKKAKTFNKSELNGLVTAFLNEEDYEVDVVKFKNGKVVSEKIQPVKDFRKQLAYIMHDAAGVDKTEASEIMSKYKFKNFDSLYPVMSESQYLYMKAGKKFEYLPKDGFAGGTIIVHKDPSEAEYTAPSTKEKGVTVKDSHDLLQAKSKIQSWRKNKKK